MKRYQGPPTSGRKRIIPMIRALQWPVRHACLQTKVLSKTGNTASARASMMLVLMSEQMGHDSLQSNHTSSLSAGIGPFSCFCKQVHIRRIHTGRNMTLLLHSNGRARAPFWMGEAGSRLAMCGSSTFTKLIGQVLDHFGLRLPLKPH